MKNLGKIVVFSTFLLVLSLALVFFKNQIEAVDLILFYSISGFSNPILDLIFIPVTYFGSLVFWVLLIVLFWLKKDKKISTYLIYAFVIDSFLLYILKWNIKKARPENILREDIFMERYLGYSFPSGHAERAFSGSVILSSFSKPYNFKIILFILSILTAISRIYIGMHYPVDVLFGSLIGIVVGNIILNLPTQKIQEKIEGEVYKIKKYF